MHAAPEAGQSRPFSSVPVLFSALKLSLDVHKTQQRVVVELEALPLYAFVSEVSLGGGMRPGACVAVSHWE